MKCADQSLSAHKVLLALGAANQEFMPKLELELEKRQLFILDLPIDDNRENLPHIIVPINNGVAYVFNKKTPGGMRVLVGQEDVVEQNEDLPEAEDYFQELLEAGLGSVMPFLKPAKVEKILWGYDVDNKILKLQTEDDQLYGANCGSAVRSCIHIGREIAAKL